MEMGGQDLSAGDQGIYALTFGLDAASDKSLSGDCGMAAVGYEQAGCMACIRPHLI